MDHRLSIITPKGTLQETWNKKKPATVEKCRMLFNDHLKQGYAAYTIEGEDLDEGELIKRFQEDAEHIVLMRPIAGG